MKSENQLKSFNEHVQSIIESKKYIYKYNHNGKDLFYYVDEVDGDLLVSDPNDAKIFTGKQIKSFDIDSSFSIGDEIFCDETGDYITLQSKPIRVEI